MNQITASTRIEASPEQVWDVVSNGGRLAEWLTPVARVRSVDAPSGLEEGSTVKIQMVGRVPPGQKMTVQEAEPSQRLKMTVGPAFAHALGIAMRAELTLQPLGEDATGATVGFTCHPVTGPLQRKIAGMDLEAHVQSTTQSLKAAAEK